MLSGDLAGRGYRKQLILNELSRKVVKDKDLAAVFDRFAPLLQQCCPKLRQDRFHLLIAYGSSLEDLEK